MKYVRLSFKTCLFFLFAAFTLLTAASCQQKKDEPWQYYGDASMQQAPPPAKPTP